MSRLGRHLLAAPTPSHQPEPAYCPVASRDCARTFWDGLVAASRIRRGRPAAIGAVPSIVVPHLVLTEQILAPPEVCFGLSLDVGLHTRSTGAREEIIGGVRSGQMALGDEVTWKAWHFGIAFRMTSRIVEYEKPRRFVDEQTRGPFARWRHEHRFEDSDGFTLMTDIVDYRSPLGPIGSVVDRIWLERYMVELLQRRNDYLREAAESQS